VSFGGGGGWPFLRCATPHNGAAKRNAINIDRIVVFIVIDFHKNTGKFYCHL
jgi:hypothetical protein